MEYKDYYAILGVNKKATQQEIKQSYRRLARKYHPDVSKEANAEEKFKNLQEAYQVLEDVDKRKAYDELGDHWKAGQDFKPPPGWNEHTRFYTNGGEAFTGDDLGGFSDFFSQLFGGAKVQRRGREGKSAGFQQRGSDQHAKILITLEEAFRGVTKTLQMQVPEADSSGRLHHHMRTLKVNVPRGAMSGQQLRLAAQGGTGIGGAPAGDLYLEIDIQPHALFSLQDHDIYIVLPVTPWEAALGAQIQVPTLAGPVGLKLAPGSQAGQKLRLKGRGMPSQSTCGDQYAILQILIPKADTPEKNQIYEKMAQLMPFNPRKDWIV
jgi:curved DNA-binding protein